MFFRILPIIFLVVSCSSLKRTILSTAVTGAAIGGIGGALFSPEKESRDKNAFIFSLVGAGVGALGGYLLHEGPMDQEVRKNMITEEEKTKVQELPLFDFSPELKEVKPQVNFKPVKKYEVPMTELPPELKGKAKKQFIMEYVSEPRTIQLGNKTIQIDSFKAWENVYEE